jgi:hypothetical protein
VPLLGIGVSFFTEAVGAGPRKHMGIFGLGMADGAELRIHPTGKAVLRISVQTQGQGHETTFAQIVGHELGFEAFLLELLAEASVTIPELGTRTATVPPIAVLTSNRTRDLHDALKRRCLYHFIGYPDVERVAAIVRRRVPGVGDPLADQVAAAVRRIRSLDLFKPPGAAEAIDWAAALRVLGVEVPDPPAATRTLAAVVKYDEDLALVRSALAELVSDD